MDAALQEAREALGRGEVPVGCAVYSKDGQLLAKGSNRSNERGNATAHAEFMALEHLRRDYPEFLHLGNLTLYVTCEPCIMCAAAIVQTGAFERIEFGCANPRFGGCGSVRSLDIHFDQPGARTYPRPAVKGGADADECIKLLTQFYSQMNPNAPNPKKRKK